jgi:ADP-ribose pyrophosphatase YjhB (NUDIX family)
MGEFRNTQVVTQLLYGDRIAKNARLHPGAFAVIYNETRTKILLVCRADNQIWVLPGGGMERGESLAGCCIREVREETGLVVEVVQLMGVYSTPHRVVAYEDGRTKQTVSFVFEAIVVGGTLTATGEMEAFGYFGRDDLAHLDLSAHHAERIQDALSNGTPPFIR